MEGEVYHEVKVMDEMEEEICHKMEEKVMIEVE
jgi:hypothetical protein